MADSADADAALKEADQTPLPEEEEEDEIDGEINTAGVSKEEMEMAEKMAGAINKAGFASVDELKGNPALLAALQAHMSGLDGLSSGLIENLPPQVKRRVKALKKIQHEHVLLEAEYQKELNALVTKFEKLNKPLYDKRETIVNGKYEPKDDECDWVDEDEEEEEEEEEKKEDGGEEGEDVKGIPDFWLTCFQNCKPVEAVHTHIINMIYIHIIILLSNPQVISIGY
eukprot:m.5186 g.5186  ORF g.5186 m.5186 type:complete len:227 (-) comp3246_c0_seq2:1039-1719(-)